MASSMIARIRYREEKIFIRSHIDRKDEMMKDIILAACKFADTPQLMNIIDDVHKQWVQHTTVLPCQDQKTQE